MNIATTMAGKNILIRIILFFSLPYIQLGKLYIIDSAKVAQSFYFKLNIRARLSASLFLFITKGQLISIFNYVFKFEVLITVVILCF